MKLLCLLLCLLHFGFAAKPQNNKQISFAYIEGVELKIPVSERLTYCKYKNTFYYAKQHFDKINESELSLLVYSYNLVSKKTDSFTVTLPFSQGLIDWSVSAITINDRNFAIQCDSIYIFNSGKKLVNVLPRRNCDEMKLIDKERILLVKNYNSHPLDDTVPSKLIVHNFKTKIIEKYIEPRFNYIIYTHLVNSFFGFSKDRLAFTQTIPYKVDFYRLRDLSITDSLSGADLRNADSLIVKIDNEHKEATKNHEAKKHIYNLQVIDTAVNRIEKVFFLNDTTLLVSKKPPGAKKFEKRSLDIWRFSNNEWHEIVANQVYQTERAENDSYLITPNSLPLDLTYSSKLLSCGNEIILVDKMVPPNMNTQSNMLKKYQDEYYSNHELNYFLWVYKWDVK